MSRQDLVAAAIVVLMPITSTPISAAEGTVERPHVIVHYKGVDAEYGEAIARLVDAAHEVYVDEFAFDMPERVTVAVNRSKRNKLRLWTDGHDRVTLTLKSSKQLRKPSKSGVFNVYGFCHELGHMAMYRTLRNRGWLDGDAAEGWAHYCGSYVIDKVHAAEGGGLWPDKYDYRTDGMQRLDRQLEDDDADDITVAAGEWQSFVNLVGKENVTKVFQAWTDADIDPEAPKKQLRKALLEAAPSADAKKLKKWFKGFARGFVVEIEGSDETYQTVSRKKLSGEAILLKHDDGSSDGKKSIAGGGHAVFFEAPSGGAWYITRVRIYGSRYGRGRAPDEDVKITLCDQDLKPIRTWTEPYATFERGEPRWYKLKVQPTSVPEKFAICFDFSPTGTKGVFVHSDDSAGGHSATGLPGRRVRMLGAGGWMIRIELDTLKTADALRKK